MMKRKYMKWLLTEDDVKFILDRFLPDNKLRMTTGLLHVVTDIFNDGNLKGYDGYITVEKLAEDCFINEKTASKHLKLLVSAGILLVGQEPERIRTPEGWKRRKPRYYWSYKFQTVRQLVIQKIRHEIAEGKRNFIDRYEDD